MADALVRRTAAAQATLDKWSKRSFRMGTADCVRMTADHLRRLGYKVKLPPAGSYRTASSALKALRERGHASVADALDAMGLKRIAPASAVVGDIVMLPGVDRLGALTIALGNGRVLGWLDEVAGGASVLQPLQYEAAWGV